MSHLENYIAAMKSFIREGNTKEACCALDSLKDFLNHQTTQEEFDKKQKEIYESLEEDLDCPKIDNPTHYQSIDAEVDIDAITCMRAAFGKDDVKSFCLCNAMKYIFRSSSKGKNTDIGKAVWYLNKFLELGGYD